MVLRIFQGFLILGLSCFSLEDFSMSFHPRTNPLVLRIFQEFFQGIFKDFSRIFRGFFILRPILWSSGFFKDFSRIFHPRTNSLVLRSFQGFFEDFSSSDQFLGLQDFSRIFHPRANSLVSRIFQGFFILGPIP